jgi:diacylglycerol O-acyltransferase
VPIEAPFEGDPVARLRAVQACTARVKRAHLAEAVEELASLGGMIPAPLYSAALALSARPTLLTWSRALRDLPLLRANVVCTNVPGPQATLYAQGRRLLAHYPVVPLAFEFGLSFAAFTYDGTLFLGSIADGGAIDDLAPLTAHVERAFDDLCRSCAAG